MFIASCGVYLRAPELSSIHCWSSPRPFAHVVDANIMVDANMTKELAINVPQRNRFLIILIDYPLIFLVLFETANSGKTWPENYRYFAERRIKNVQLPCQRV